MSPSPLAPHAYPPAPLSTPVPDTVSYLVHTQTDGVSDLRLQVSRHQHQHQHQPDPGPISAPAAPAKPIWFRERTLSEHNEIVDRLVDASTAEVAWSIHRPTRGWYLHLRSPLLPPATAITLRPTDTDHLDPSVSPLSFSLGTRINQAALSAASSAVQIPEPSSSRVPLDTSSTRPGGRDASELTRHAAPTIRVSSNGKERAPDLDQAGDADTESDQALATGRSASMHVSTESGKGHARRRSAAGSGTHAPGSRKASAKFDAKLSRSPILERMDGRSRSADRPYSPIQPQPFGLRGTSSTDTCTFVLCDGARRPATSQSGITLTGPQGWARWAWAIVPRDLRPVLCLETSKSFSLWWIDPPRRSPVEVLRFDDQSGWWIWNASTRGVLSIQTKAIEAIGLHSEFWVATALAYLEFLEDKHGYQAAQEG